MQLNQVSWAAPPPGARQVLFGDADRAAVDRVELGGNQPMLFKSLIPPPPQAAHARHNTPVVVIHGTQAGKESISEYPSPVGAAGHPVDLDTLVAIKEGDRLETSGQLISRQINNDRITVARDNVAKLQACDLEGVQRFLGMRDDLYGAKDAGVGPLAALVPPLVDRIDRVLALDRENLLDTFSTRMRDLEKELLHEVEQSGYGPQSGKVAAEIVDAIAPHAVIVGHSMGGFIGYVVALNPRSRLGDESEFTYDAGNGIGAVTTLSSPVGRGVRVPLPHAVENYAFDTYQKEVLDPLEATPGMRMARLNPWFDAWYETNKAAARAGSAIASDTTASMTSPYTYAKSPGYAEISEGSDFIHRYLEGKKLPEGVTAVAFACQDDGISEADRSAVDDSQPNQFNVDAKVEVPEEFLKRPGRTRAVLSHYMMARDPARHGEEFKTQILENPHAIPRVLDPRNYDGIRWECMNTLLACVRQDPAFFRKPGMDAALNAVREVARERLPFVDSPSYVARQILDAVAAR